MKQSAPNLQRAPSADHEGGALHFAQTRKTDAIYYEHAGNLALAQRVSIHARTRMYQHFLETMRPDAATAILDFGVSEHVGADANALERMHPHQNRITCAGIGDGQSVRETFPEVRYVSIAPGARLPFADQSFDVGCSNAVFEHLGSDAERAVALGEILRVSRRVYITVPNRWFPIEHHTAIPILHFLPPLFRTLLARTPLRFWSDARNMDFMSKRRMRSLCPSNRRFEIAYCGIVLGPLSSNIALYTPATPRVP
jgi:SAM-dependent methyltransferase